MTSRSRWRAAFLTVTALAIGMELIAAFDRRPDTDPWTNLLVTYVPAPVTYVAIGLLVLWLPAHFWRRYRRRGRDGTANTIAARRPQMLPAPPWPPRGQRALNDPPPQQPTPPPPPDPRRD